MKEIPDEAGLVKAFPVVALGASAGGLQALQTLFEAMPADTGMAFIVVVHLDPTHESLLPELIRRKTDMEVLPAEDGVRVRPNHVYVIPPNRDLKISRGCLRLEGQALPRGANLPIDTFLRSLAKDQGERAACIILSGAGSDGTLGLRAIKGEAGLVIVQEEESARYRGMPRSALDTGLADFVLAPAEIPGKLVEYMARAVMTPGNSGDLILEPEEDLRAILLRLRARTGHDFTGYKKATVSRRVARRMHMHQIESLSDYAKFLRKSDREVQILFRELLIGVTSFFRDPAAFESLREQLLLAPFRGREKDGNVRVWVPGCSTGEEAYSVAILLHEVMDAREIHSPFQIFATDLDEEAVRLARAAWFPPGVANDVSPQHLERYFSPGAEGGYQIRKRIRDDLVFAPQNLIKDPPFSGVDLITCRNLLIYLTPALQKRVLSLFHYALNPGGILFLGSAESIGEGGGLFETVDKKWKIFRKIPSDPLRRTILAFPAREPDIEMPVERASRPPEEVPRSMELLEAILKQSQTPPSAVVDGNNRVVYLHGNTDKYLRLPEGYPELDLLAMARHGLRKALTEALRKAGEAKNEVVDSGLRVRHEGGTDQVDLVVRPIVDPGAYRDFMIVSFREVQPVGSAEATADPAEGRTAEDLALELQTVTEDLQSTMEELETSNEELRSSNEELQSANEELQSTNEELETSKEELQSLHEEAETVNAELQGRVEELGSANDDLKNLLDSTQIATVFLDVDLRIRRFTPMATEVIPLTDADVGRPLADLAAHLQNVDLSACAQEVLNSLVPSTVSVLDAKGESLLMRVTPYRTQNNVIDGVVLTFQEGHG